MAEGDRPRFRGGGIHRRDRLFGLERYEDVGSFLRWWHRVGKRYNGEDLTAHTARHAYDEWVELGRPKVE